jgi:protein-S-isoprenylcysteine O-methyltransferase Ste14
MSNKQNRWGRKLENAIPPPVVFVATAAAMALAHALLPPWDLSGVVSYGIGAAGVALASVMGPAAVWRFARAGTTVNPVAIERASVLVTAGVYRWSRNPMYLALASLLVGMAGFAADPRLLFGPVAFVLFIARFQIEPEERAMRQIFGADFDAYCARVRRWL